MLLTLYIIIAGLSLANALKFEDESNWKGYCKGKRQSPIDVVTANTVNVTDWAERLRFSGYSKPLSWKIKNSGSHIKVMNFEKNQEEKIILRGGGLQGIYYAVSMNVFWENGSVHSLDGQFYSMEWQIIHMKKTYKNMREALSKPDGIAVLTFFANVSDVEDGPLEEFSKQIATIDDYKVLTDLPTEFSFSTLINAVNQYQFYTYFGSITTPPCFESTYYMMFPKIIPISRKSFSHFQALLNYIDSTSKTAIRSLQKLHERSIYFYDIKQPESGYPNINSTEAEFGIQPFSRDVNSTDTYNGSTTTEQASSIPYGQVDQYNSIPTANLLAKLPFGSPSTSSSFNSIDNSDDSSSGAGASIPHNQANDQTSQPISNITYAKVEEHPSIAGTTLPSDQLYGQPSVIQSSTLYGQPDRYPSVSRAGAAVPHNNFDHHPSGLSSSAPYDKYNGYPSTQGHNLPYDKLHGESSFPSTSKPFGTDGRYSSISGLGIPSDLSYGSPSLSSAFKPIQSSEDFSSGAEASKTPNKVSNPPSRASSGTPYEKNYGYPSTQGYDLPSNQLYGESSFSSTSKPYATDGRYSSISGLGIPSDLPYGSPSLSSAFKPIESNEDFSSGAEASKTPNKVSNYPSKASSGTPYDKNYGNPSTQENDLPYDQFYGESSGPSISKPYSKEDRYLSITRPGTPSDLPYYMNNVVLYDDSDNSILEPRGVFEHSSVNDQFSNMLQDKSNEYLSTPGSSFPLNVQSYVSTTSTPYKNNDRYLSVGSKPSVLPYESHSTTSSTFMPIDGFSDGSFSRAGSSRPTNQVNDHSFWPSSGALHDKDNETPSIPGSPFGITSKPDVTFASPSISTSSPRNHNGGYTSASQAALSPYIEENDIYRSIPVSALSYDPLSNPNYLTHYDKFGRPSISTTSSLHSSADNPSLPSNKLPEYSSWPSSETPNDNVAEYSSIASFTPPYDQPSVSRTLTPPSDRNPFGRPTSSPLKHNDGYQSEPGALLPYNRVVNRSSLPSATLNLTHDNIHNQPSVGNTSARNGILNKEKRFSSFLPSAGNKYQFNPNHSFPTDEIYDKSSVARLLTTHGSDSPFSYHTLPVSLPSVSASTPINYNDSYQPLPGASFPTNRGYDYPSLPNLDIPFAEDDEYTSKHGPALPYDELNDLPSFARLLTPRGSDGRYSSTDLPFGRPSITASTQINTNGGYSTLPRASLPLNKGYDYPSSPGLRTPHDEDDKYPSKHGPVLPHYELNDQASFANLLTPRGSDSRYTFDDLPFRRPSISTSIPINTTGGYSSLPGASLPPNKGYDYPSLTSLDTPSAEDDKHPSTHGPALLYDELNDQPSFASLLTPRGSDGRYSSTDLPFGRPSFTASTQINTNGGYSSLPGASLPPNKGYDYPSLPSLDAPFAEDDKHPSMHGPALPYDELNDQPSFASLWTPRGSDGRYLSTDLPFGRPSITASTQINTNGYYSSLPGATLPPNRGYDYPSLPSLDTPFAEDDEYPSKHGPALPYDELNDQPSFSSLLTPRGSDGQYSSTDLPFGRPSITASTQINTNGGYSSLPRPSVPPNKGYDYPSLPGLDTPHDEDDKYPSKHGSVLPHDELNDQASVTNILTPRVSDSRYSSDDLPFRRPFISTSTPVNTNGGYSSLPRASLPPNKGYDYPSLPSLDTPFAEDDKHPSKHRPAMPYDELNDQTSFTSLLTPRGAEGRYSFTDLPFGRPSITASTQINTTGDYSSLPGASLPPNKGYDYPSLPSLDTPFAEDDKYPSKHGPVLPHNELNDQASVADLLAPRGSDSRYSSDNLPFRRASISTSTPINTNGGYSSLPGASLPPNKGYDYPSLPSLDTPLAEDDKHPSKHGSALPYDELNDQPSFASLLTPRGSDGRYSSTDLPFGRPSISASTPIDNSYSYPSLPEASLPPNKDGVYTSLPSLDTLNDEDDENPSKHGPILPHDKLNDQPSARSISIPHDSDSLHLPDDLPFGRPSISSSSPIDNSHGYSSLPEASLPSSKGYSHPSLPSLDTLYDEDDEYPSLHERALPYEELNDQPSVASISTLHDSDSLYSSDDLPFGRASISTSSPPDKIYSYPSLLGASLTPNKGHSLDTLYDEDDEYPSKHGPALSHDVLNDQPSIASISTPDDSDNRYSSDDSPFGRPSISTSSSIDSNDGYPSLPGTSLASSKDDGDPSLLSLDTLYDDDDEYPSKHGPALPHDELNDQPSSRSISTPHDSESLYQPDDLPFGRPSISSSSPIENSHGYPSLPDASLPPNKGYSLPSLLSLDTLYDEDDEYPSLHERALPYEELNDQPSVGSISIPIDTNDGYISLPGASLPPTKVNNRPSVPGLDTLYDKDDKYPSKHGPALPYDELYDQPSTRSISTPHDSDSLYLPDDLPFGRPSISSSSPIDNSHGYPSLPEASLPPNKGYSHPSLPSLDTLYDEDDEYPPSHERALPYDELNDQPSVGSISTPIDTNDGYFSLPGASLPPTKVNNRRFVPSLDTFYDEDDEYPSKHGPALPHDVLKDQPSVASISTPDGSDNRYSSDDLPFGRPSISTSSPMDNNDGYPSLPGTSLPSSKDDGDPSLLSLDKLYDEDDEYPSKHGPALPYDELNDQPSNAIISTLHDSDSLYSSDDLPFGRPSISTSSPFDKSYGYPSLPGTSFFLNKGYSHPSLPSLDTLFDEDDEYLSSHERALPYDGLNDQPSVGRISTPIGTNDSYPSLPEASLPPAKVNNRLSVPNLDTPFDEDDEYPSDEYDETRDSPHDSDIPYSSDDLPFSRPSISSASPIDNDDGYPSLPGVSLPPIKDVVYPSLPSLDTFNEHDSYPSKHGPALPYNELYDQPSASSISTPHDSGSLYLPDDLPFGRPSISSSSPIDSSHGYPSLQEASLPTKKGNSHSSLPSYDTLYGEDDEYPSSHERALPCNELNDQPSVASISTPIDTNVGYPSVPGASVPPNKVNNRPSVRSLDTAFDEDGEYPPDEYDAIHGRPHDSESRYSSDDLPFGRPSISSSSPIDNNDGYPSLPGASLPPIKDDVYPSLPSLETLNEDDSYPSKHRPALPYNELYDQPSARSISTPHDSGSLYLSDDLPFGRPSISSSSPIDSSHGYPSLPEASLPTMKGNSHFSLPTYDTLYGEDDEYPSSHERALPYDELNDQPSVASISTPIDTNVGYPSVPGASVPPNKVNNRPSVRSLDTAFDEDDEYPSDEYDEILGMPNDSDSRYSSDFLLFGRPSISSSSPIDSNDGYPSLPGASLPSNKEDGDPSVLSLDTLNDDDDEYPSKHGPALQYDELNDQPSFVGISALHDSDSLYPSDDLLFGGPSISTASPIDNNDGYPSLPGASLPSTKGNNRPSLPTIFDTPYGEDNDLKYDEDNPLAYDKLYGQPSFSSIAALHDLDSRYLSDDLPFRRPFISTSTHINSGDGYPLLPGASVPPNYMDEHSSFPYYNTLFDEDDEYPLNGPLPYDEVHGQPSTASISTKHNSGDRHTADVSFGHASISSSPPLDNSVEYPSVLRAFLPPNKGDKQPFLSSSDTPFEEDDMYQSSIPGASLPTNKINQPPLSSSNALYEEDDEFRYMPELPLRYSKIYGSPFDDEYLYDLPFSRPSVSISSPNKFIKHTSRPSSDTPLDGDDDYLSIAGSFPTPHSSNGRYLSDLPVGRPSISTSSPLENSDSSASIPGDYLPLNFADGSPSLPSLDNPYDDSNVYQSKPDIFSPYEQLYGQPSVASISSPYNTGDRYSPYSPNYINSHPSWLSSDTPYAQDKADEPCRRENRRNLQGSKNGVWWQRLLNGVNATFTDIDS